MEYRKSTPQILVKPYIIKLNYYNVDLGIKLWENGLIYAIIREFSKDPTPFSSQIYKGQDKQNKKIRNYRNVSNILALATQETVLSFDDLQDNTQYQVFITAASILPYENAVNLYEDQ